MDKVHTVSTPMISRCLDPKKDPFHPSMEDKEIFRDDIPYLGTIGALLHMAQCT